MQEKYNVLVSEIEFIKNENQNLKLNKDIIQKENENLRKNNRE